MKNKDILNTIKKDIESNTPNIMTKIDLNSIDIKETVVLDHKKGFSFFNLKVLIPVTSFLMVIVIVVALLFNNKPSVLTKDVKVTNKDLVVANYATQALEMDLINSHTLTIFNMAQDIYINRFDKYSILLQEYLNLTNSVVSIVQTNDKQYPYTMNIVYTDFFGKENHYTLKYFEEREIDSDEVEKEMEGIIIFDNITYNFKAEQELEASEEEIEITIKSNDGYEIKIEKEVENNDYQMEYIVKYNNKTILDLIFEVDKNEINFEIKKDNEKYEYVLIELEPYYYEVTIEDTLFTLQINKELKTFNYNKTVFELEI